MIIILRMVIINANNSEDDDDIVYGNSTPENMSKLKRGNQRTIQVEESETITAAVSGTIKASPDTKLKKKTVFRRVKSWVTKKFSSK